MIETKCTAWSFSIQPCLCVHACIQGWINERENERPTQEEEPMNTCKKFWNKLTNVIEPFALFILE